MNLMDSIKSSKLVFGIRISIEMIKNISIYSCNLSNFSRKDNARKMQTDIIIRTHALEKGMSIGKVKPGFGKPKVLSLIKGLNDYIKVGGLHRIVEESCSVIGKYIEFNIELGVDMTNLKKVYEDFIESNSVHLINNCGVYIIDHAKIEKEQKQSFDLFSQCRFSIRDFGEKTLNIEQIKYALKLCERTPSACNRQGWSIHVYTDKKLKNEILNLQLGNKGFTEDVQGAILICGNLNNYGFPEFNLPFVDAGIYAMNLMYSLNYNDIASIPLTMSHKISHTKKIRKLLGLPDNEIPAILIGIGTYKENFKVAISNRQPYQEYTKFNL